MYFPTTCLWFECKFALPFAICSELKWGLLSFKRLKKQLKWSQNFMFKNTQIPGRTRQIQCPSWVTRRRRQLPALPTESSYIGFTLCICYLKSLDLVFSHKDTFTVNHVFRKIRKISFRQYFRHQLHAEDMVDSVSIKVWRLCLQIAFWFLY